MKIKIKNFNPDEISTSASAKMTRFLIRINLLPVYARDNFEDVRFSWISLRTFVYLLMTYMPVTILVILFKVQPEFVAKYFEEVGKYYATIDIMAFFAFISIPLLLGPIFVLLVSEAFCQLKVITLRPSLKFMEWSDFGAFVSGYILC